MGCSQACTCRRPCRRGALEQILPQGFRGPSRRLIQPHQMPPKTSFPHAATRRLPNTQEVQSPTDSIHTVIKSTTQLRRAVGVKLLENREIAGKSVRSNPKYRSERHLLFNRLLFQGPKHSAAIELSSCLSTGCTERQAACRPRNGRGVQERAG